MSKTINNKNLRGSVSAWLTAGMQAGELNQSTLAERSGVARETVWRLVHGRTDASEWTLRRLAEAMGGPPPTSDEIAAAHGTTAGASGEDADRLRTEPEGWVFGAPREAEEQFVSFLRNIERTTRAMVGNPDLFSAEENRTNQLAVCRGVMRSAEVAGRPVPPWLPRIYTDVIRGRFR